MCRFRRRRPSDRGVGTERHARRDRSVRADVERLHGNHTLIGDVPCAFPTKQLVGDDGERKLIGPTIEVGAVAALLERHVRRGTQLARTRRGGAAGNGHARPKVGHETLAVLVQQNLEGADGAMNDPSSMCLVERAGDLAQDRSHILKRHRAAFLKPVVERPGRGQRHLDHEDRFAEV